MQEVKYTDEATLFNASASDPALPMADAATEFAKTRFRELGVFSMAGDAPVKPPD